jgi:hypothetical protein
MTANDDDHSSAASKDLARYMVRMAVGDIDACIRIKKKYGLYGLSPQQVAEELAEIAAIQEDARHG